MNAIGSFFRSIYKNKRAFVGFIILLMFVFSATLGAVSGSARHDDALF